MIRLYSPNSEIKILYKEQIIFYNPFVENPEIIFSCKTIKESRKYFNSLSDNKKQDIICEYVPLKSWNKWED